MRLKRPIADEPDLRTAAPKIPCWTARPKANTKTIRDKERQKRLRALLAPLKAILEGKR